MPHEDDEITEKTGLFYAAYRLGMLGWNVLLASRTAVGLDMLIYSTEAKRRYAVEVKTLSAHNDVPPSSSKRKPLWDFFIICDLNRQDKRIEASYILDRDEYDHGLHTYGNGTRAPQRSYFSQFKDMWDKIGDGRD